MATCTHLVLSTTERTILPRPNQGAGTQRSGSAPRIPNHTASSPEKHSCRRPLGPTRIPASASHARRRLHRFPPFFLAPRGIARVPVFGYWVSFQFEISSLIAL